MNLEAQSRRSGGSAKEPGLRAFSGLVCTIRTVSTQLRGKLKAKARAAERKKRSQKRDRRDGSSRLRIPVIVWERLRVDTLDGRHPLHRDRLHEQEHANELLARLAEDIEAIRTAPGEESLMSAMRKNWHHFEDFRYELRMAAHIARGGQKILALAGTHAGPDIVFIANSGHKVGAACYRANSRTELTLALRRISRRIADETFPTFCTAPLGTFGVDVFFQDREPTPAIVTESLVLVKQLLIEANVSADLSAPGVTVKRHLIDMRLAGEVRCVRLRVAFKTKPFEQARVVRHLQDKIEKESGWARQFEGASLLMIEGSDGTQNTSLKDPLKAILYADKCPFWGALISWLPSGGLESFEHTMVPERSIGLDVGIATSGPNMHTWAGDMATLSFSPDDSWEHWDFVERKDGMGSFLVQSLTTGVHSLRVPQPRTFAEVQSNEGFKESLAAKASEIIRANADHFPKASVRNFRLLPDY